MKTLEGNLLDLAESGVFDVIVHGCNCFCTMGRGIALEVKKRYPQVYYSDTLTAKGDRNKLGTYSAAGVYIVEHDHGFYVVNGYTQYDWHPGQRNADYDAIRAVFAGVKQDFGGMRIGYPLIGAGLAGGDWNIISAIIEEELEGEDHTLVVLPS